MGVRPEHDDGALDIAGNHRGDSRALHAERGRAELAEDEDIIERKVHQYRRDARLHGQHGLPRLAQGAGIGHLQGEGRELIKHDGEVVLRVAKGGLHVKLFRPLVDELPDQRVAAEGEHRPEAQHRREGDIELGAEGVGHAPRIPAAVKLGREDARARKAAENAEVENKEKLVYDGDAGHGLRPYLSDHDVIQQAHKICDEVLDQNGDQNDGEPPVKGPVADVLFEAHARHLPCNGAQYSVSRRKLQGLLPPACLPLEGKVDRPDLPRGARRMRWSSLCVRFCLRSPA